MLKSTIAFTWHDNTLQHRSSNRTKERPNSQKDIRKQYENEERSEKSWNMEVLRDVSGTISANFSSFCLLFTLVKYKH